MTTTSEVTEARSPAPRRNRPVVLWAVVGTFFVVLQTWIYGNWLFNDDLKRTPVGVSDLPTHTKLFIAIYQPAGLIVAALFLYFVVWRPWRRTGLLNVDGRLSIAFALVYWQDPLINYFQLWATYNTGFWNVGSWATHIPGWQSPHGARFAEPVIAFLPAYVYGVFGMVIVGSHLMRLARDKWGLTPLGTYGTGLLWFFVADLLLEVPWILLGFDTFGGSPAAMTLFHGTNFQMPLWEPVLFAPAFALWGHLRLTAGDDDVTWVERGVDRVDVAGWKRTAVKTLALVGAVNAIFLVYNVPVSMLGTKAEAWPVSIEDKPFFTNGLCGPHADYACSDRSVPIPQPGSSFIAPDGSLMPPPGSKR